MMNKKHLSMVLTALVFCIGAVNSALAQNQRWQGREQKDPLMFLQRAIQKSGAPALSSDQQSQLQSLIKDYRSAQQSTGPDPAVQNARQNLGSAVLTGNSANATAAADVLASALAANIPKRLEALANFEVQVLGILQPQAPALKQSLGNDGLVSLLGSLAGGPGMRAGMGAFGRR